MYCYSPSITRSPSVLKAARNASIFPSSFTVYTPRSPPTTNEFAPFLRLLDDFVAPLTPAYTQQGRNMSNSFDLSRPGYQPRFDVREVGTNYELDGELPGASGIEVDFTDPQTLVVRGRVGTNISEDKPSVKGEQATTEQGADTEPQNPSIEQGSGDTASIYSTGSYQKPSVEEDEFQNRDSASAISSADTHARAPLNANQPQEQYQQGQESEHVASQVEKQVKSQYWVKERNTGSFQRVFKFEAPIDVAVVKATLKNGILSIIAPKASAPSMRKIFVE